MRIIFSAIVVTLALGASALSADPYLPTADDSAAEVVRNVCERPVQDTTLAQACWVGNGSSSKQFGSEGGSTGADSGESAAK